MVFPDYIDNKQHYLHSILHEIIVKEEQKTLDIATGYFKIEAWQRLEDALNHLTQLRLLIGREPSIYPCKCFTTTPNLHPNYTQTALT